MSKKIFYLCFILFLSACTKQSPIVNNPPVQQPPTQTITVAVLSTKNADNITGTTARIGGIITSNGNGNITERGICYSNTNKTPTVNDVKIIDVLLKNDFTIGISALTEDTKYYVRAFAVNEKGISYGQVVVFQTTPPAFVKDYDGNSYYVVKIGNQYWTGNNFTGKHYNDGTEIIETTARSSAWFVEAGRKVWMYNNFATYSYLGPLYNWYTVKGDNIAPKGWHVPTLNDYKKLLSSLTKDQEGTELKANYTWTMDATINAPNRDKTNFRFLGSGYLTDNGSFGDPFTGGGIWLLDEKDNTKAYAIWLSNTTSIGMYNNFEKSYGFSIRFVKDE